MSLRIIVLAKQVPDTRNVGKDAMKEDGTVSKITTEYLGVDTSPDEKYFDETPN